MESYVASENCNPKASFRNENSVSGCYSPGTEGIYIWQSRIAILDVIQTRNIQINIEGDFDI